MTMASVLREEIVRALQGCAGRDFAGGARALLNTLGYRSDRTIPLEPNSAEGFVEFLRDMGRSDGFNPVRARTSDWRSVDLLFQLSDSELAPSAQSRLGLDSWEPGLYKSFLFLAIDLAGNHYTRTDLSEMTRAVNRPFSMPVPILFRCDDRLTLAIILRRQHKRDAEKDVLEKVTLIKDIALAQPHAGHVRILEDLALDNLGRAFY
jgi:adenine-specific DNA-methyltransferase